MQLFCQEKLILASHPWLSLEEAKKKESKKRWCLLIFGTVIMDWFIVDNDGEVLYNVEIEDNEIIWLPPSLPRVLNTLKWVWIFAYIWWCIEIYREEWYWNTVYPRKLLNEDWTSCDLRQQSEETQNAIALLLGWKDA